MRKNVLHVAALLVPLLLGALTGVGQTVTDPSLTAGYDEAKRAAIASPEAPAAAVLTAGKPKAQALRANLTTQIIGGCFIAYDDTYTTLARNDDGSFGPIALPFDFHLYGTIYRQVWINTNGNLTFLGPSSTFSSSGFPSKVPMVAPFWADVDTRNPAGGLIRFKLNATNLIVTWDNVGYYNNWADKRNTFQAIIGSPTDALLGVGQNVSLRYLDMQWTTGSASGGTSGFAGVGATVGANNGNNVDFVQVGRFSLNNSNYDGPGGAYDGVNYLDGQCIAFNVSGAGNVPPSASNLPLNNTVNVTCGQTVTLNPRFLAPEVNQTVSVAVNTGDLCNTTVTTTSGANASANIVITGNACNAGSHPLVLTATDSGSPTGVTTVTLNVVVSGCCNLQLAGTATPATCPGSSTGALDLTTSHGAAPFTYQWSNGATTEDLTNVPAGSYTVTVTDANSCKATATYAVIQQDDEAPVVRTRNITLPLSANGMATLTASEVDNGSSDNCTYSLAVDRTTFDCSNLGPNTVTLTVTDPADHRSSMAAIVTVVDALPPTIGAPAAVAASTDQASCSASEVVLGSPLVSDNCAGTVVTNNAPAIFPKGLTVVTWTATDASGNVATAAQEVTVTDNRPPIVVAQNIIVPLDATGNATITAAQIDNGSFDGCGIASISVSPSAFTCENSGPNTVTLTVTDAEGNVATATAVATVVDDTAPKLYTRPATVYLNAAGQASLTTEQVTSGFADGCGVASIVVNTTSFDCSKLGANTVDVTATDIHGNVTVSSAVVTVADTLAPAMSGLPALMSARASANTCSASVSWTNPEVADNCSVTLTSSHQSGSAFPVGVTTVVLTATDPAGNRTSRSFQVTVLCEAMLATVSSPTFGLGAADQSGSSTGYNVGCYGAHTGTATASITGGCQPYRYLWSNGQTSATATGLAAGNYTVTITDANGTRLTRSITLTQAPAIVAKASVTPGTSFSGALPNTIYLGYGAQSLTLQGEAAGGVGGYTYTWAPATGLSSTSGSTVSASPTATTTYTVTATDANGCTAAKSSVTVNVQDVRSGTEKAKVRLCHNGQEISIATSAVQAHLAHRGDQLGSCNATLLRGSSPAALSQAPLFEVYPNPLSKNATVKFRQVATARAQVRIYDAKGRVVAVLFNGMAEAGRDYPLVLNAEALPTGLYLCRYESQGQTLTQRLSIIR